MTGTTKKETRAHTLLHGCLDISIIYIYTKSPLNVIDSLGLSFQIKWFTDCQCKPVAVLHSPCVTLCHPALFVCVLSCTWLLWNICKICCIVLITNVCTRTAEKAHVLHLLLFKGCLETAYLRPNNDFGVTFFFDAHQLSRSFPCVQTYADVKG